MADNSTVSYPMGRLFTGIPTGDAPTKPVLARASAVPIAKSDIPAAGQQQADAPTREVTNDFNGSVLGGEYDGYVRISFSAGNGYSYSFSFALPNVIGNLGVAGINDVAITEMIERALVDKLGRGGVVRHKTES